MIEKKEKLLLVTTTRADWGILSPLARALTLHPEANLCVAVGNMHLMPEYGHTVDEVVKEMGNERVYRLELPSGYDSDAASTRTAIMAATADSLACLIEKTRPSGIILLGDRYELVGAATAALIAGVPIIHLHGGEVTEGAIDDAVRNAVSKMATLHLVATEKSAERLKAMGEEESRIVVTGAIGVENSLATEMLTQKELTEALDGFELDPDRTLLVTFHPVTLHPEKISVEEQLDNLLGAIESVKECNAIITFPNNDLGSEKIIKKLTDFAEKNPDRIKLVKSLGSRRYLSAMQYVKAVVGNTSSGIIEAPSTPAYTLDIGPRQSGRERTASVIHVEDDREAIESALTRIVNLPRRDFKPEDNPYYRKDSVKRCVRAIIETLPSLSPIKKH